MKRARSDYRNSSKGKFEGQGRPRFKRWFYNQGSSSAPRIKKDRVSNPKSQGGNSGGSSMMRITCVKCVVAKGREDKQNPPSGSNSDAPKKNRFYALQSRGDQESSPDVMTGMLQVFSIDLYALLDSGDTLSFVTPFVAMKFEILPEVLIESFPVSTPVGNSVGEK
uniref:Gag-pol polyprotein n=1 Tax=Solanum tuberosum TaxID=4113 RepID=M1DV13_SOLTU